MRVRALVLFFALSPVGFLVGGCAGSGFKLPLPAPPRIITQPTNQTVTAGQPATFIVVAEGAGSLSYQWHKNGNAIPGATSEVYNTPPTTLADNGAIFSVVVNNSTSNGSVTSTVAALTVTPLPAAPAITSANNVTAVVGTAGSFAVATTGYPAPALTETGTLPNGVTFVDNGNGTGTLAGTPAPGTGKTYSVTFNASNGVGSSASQSFTLTVDQAPGIASPNSVAFPVGASASFTVITAGFPAPSLTETGALPSGVTFVDNGNGTGTLAGTPAAGMGKAYSVTLAASNGVGSPASQSFTLTVDEAPAITSPNSTAFSLGAPGSFTVTTTGFPASTLTETGALPSGVIFTNSGNGTGTLSGTPASGTGGTYAVSFTATNGVGTPASQNFTLTVDAGPVITSGVSTTFTVGTSGTFSVNSTGTPTPSLTETGTLPSGVTLVDNHNGTGTLSGTPAPGTGASYPITIKASSSSGTTSQNFMLTVDQAPAITSANNATFTVGLSGLFSVITTGFPAAALTETGALPNGVTFADNGNGTGKLIGIPAPGTGKTYPITLTANNAVGSAVSQNFTLTVDEAPAISNPSSVTFTVGTTSTFNVTTTGFPAPSLTETGTLPSGVTFKDNGNGSGTVSGMPAAGTGGTYPVTIKASSSSGTTSQSFTLTVDQVPALTSANSTTFTVGAAGTFSVAATGFPAPSLTVTGALPGGVSFKDNGNGTGTLAGTPAAGTGKTYSVTLTASNGAGSSASQSFTLTVDQAPSITSPSSTTYTVGTSASFAITTTGFPAPALTETGTLPSGVTFVDNGNGTGTLSGTPASASAGTYTIAFTASNNIGSPATQIFALTVNNPNSAPVITSSVSTTFTVGTSGTFSVTSTGTPTPSLTETGALPTGVTFKDNGNGTGTLAGTPAASTGKAYAITFAASNGVGIADTQTFTLTVDQAPSITSPKSTTFTAGSSASFTVLTTGFPAPALSETGKLPSGVTFTDNGNGTGTLNGTAASGAAGTYSLTLTASNGVGTSATQTFSLTVNAATVPPVITSAGSTTFTTGTAGTFSVTATGTPTPSLTETGTLPSGVAFKDNGNGTGTLSGAPATGTAGTYPITFTATNGSGTSATQSFALTVASGIACGSGHESVLNGQYAFLFHGFDANGPAVIEAMFSADGTGKVALLAGVEDISTTTGVQTNVPINSAASSYSVGSDNRGCLTLAAGATTSKYAFSLGSLNTSGVSARGRMIEIDSTGTLGSGELRLQDPTAFSTAAITGSFNFGVSTTLSLSTTVPNRFGMVGRFTASAGAITGGEADFNLSGSVDGGVAGPAAVTGGSYSVSSNGRGTLSLTISGAGTFNANIYVVSAKEFFLINIGAQSPTNPLFAGAAHLQSGTFATSSLSGNSVFYTIGLCTSCGPGSTVAPDLSVGIINVATAGSFTLTGDQNQGGMLTTQSLSGTYTVDASGRAVLSGTPSPYIVYLETTGRGFLLTTGSEVGEGFVDPQKGAPFTNASLTLPLSSGTTDQAEENVTDSSGIATFNGAGTVSGTTDSAALGSAPSSNAFSEPYSITDGTTGRGTITSNGATVSIFYLISTTHLVLMDASNSSGAPNPHPAISSVRQ